MTLTLLLAAIVLLGAFVQTLTGFGLNMVAVTLGALLIPLETWLPVVVAINLPLTGWIAWRHRAEIDRPLLLRRILPLMLAGGVAGFGIAAALDADILRRVFGLVVIVIALRDLGKLTELLAAGHAARPAPWMVAAGVAQGMYATGGPFLVHAVAGLKLPRLSYRATLMSVWFVLNAALTLAFVLSGRWSPVTVTLVAWMVPFIFIGMWLANAVDARIAERQFAVCVQMVLLLAGLALLF